jgi:hypothetical protein
VNYWVFFSCFRSQCFCYMRLYVSRLNLWCCNKWCSPIYNFTMLSMDISIATSCSSLWVVFVGCALLRLTAAYFPSILNLEWFLLLCDNMYIVKGNMLGFSLINLPPFSWMSVTLSGSCVIDTCIDLTLPIIFSQSTLLSQYVFPWVRCTSNIEYRFLMYPKIHSVAANSIYNYTYTFLIEIVSNFSFSYLLSIASSYVTCT